MKKKYLITLLTLVFSFILVAPTYAATLTDSSGFDLNVGASSATTQRIHVPSGQKLEVSIHMYLSSAKKPLTYKIFKSGVEYSSGSINGTSVRSVEKSMTVPSGDYSLRVYSASKTGNAYGGLQTFKK